MSEAVEEVKGVTQVEVKSDEIRTAEEMSPPAQKTEDPPDEVKPPESASSPDSPSGQFSATTESSVPTSPDDSNAKRTPSPDASESIDVRFGPNEIPVDSGESESEAAEEAEKARPAETSNLENNKVEEEKLVPKAETTLEEKKLVPKAEITLDESSPEEEDGVNVDENVEDGEIVEEEEEEDEFYVEDEDFSSAESEISKNSSGENSKSSNVEGETEEKREEGDGEEEKKDKTVDQAEDRRNPQYIPRKGFFYEHDDRTSDDPAAGDKAEPDAPQKPNKKPASSDMVDRWGHDLFDEAMQSPKSTQELIDAYGYDIRKEDGPPKARRSRHYGKGPNKYQRSWEDEQAYNKSSGFRGGRKPPFRNSRPKNFTNREEDFPSLGNESGGKPTRPELNRKNKSWTTGQNREEGRPQQTGISNEFGRSSRKQVSFQDRNASPGRRGGSNRFGGGEFRRPGRDIPSRTSTLPASAPTVNREPSKDKFDNEDIATLAQHFSNAVINVDKKNIVPIKKGSAAPAPASANNAPHQGSVPKSIVISSTSCNQPTVPSHPPQASEQRKEDRPNEATSAQQEKNEVTAKSKRYSTQRQRSVPHQQQVPLQVSSTTTPVPPQLHPPATTSPNTSYLPHPPPNFFTPPPPPATCMEPPPQFQAPPPPGAMVTFIPGVNPNQAYQPPPPQYIPHQYMTVPSHVAAGPPPPPPGAPPEVYQGGGITYYNTQSQIPPRPTPSRRIKLAIPIVAPDSQQSIQ